MKNNFHYESKEFAKIIFLVLLYNYENVKNMETFLFDNKEIMMTTFHYF